MTPLWNEPPLTKPYRHQPPTSISIQSSTRSCPCMLPTGRYRPRSEDRHSVEHLACVHSASSPQAIRPPPTMPPRHRPCLGFLNVLAQPHPIFLSPCFWPCSPHAAARQRAPRIGSSPTVSTLISSRCPPPLSLAPLLLPRIRPLTKTQRLWPPPSPAPAKAWPWTCPRRGLDADLLSLLCLSLEVHLSFL
jgi:hypothetical protein